jgi:hypothetical protein
VLDEPVRHLGVGPIELDRDGAVADGTGVDVQVVFKPPHERVEFVFGGQLITRDLGGHPILEASGRRTTTIPFVDQVRLRDQ